MMTDMEEVEAMKLQSQIEKRNNTENEADFKEASKKLAEGLLSLYRVQLELVEKKLDEARNKQDTLLGQMQVEDKKLENSFNNTKLEEMLQAIRNNEGKLIVARREMASVHERTYKLKKRALRLQQIKQKEASNREQQREQEIRREQELIGKPVIN